MGVLIMVIRGSVSDMVGSIPSKITIAFQLVIVWFFKDCNVKLRVSLPIVGIINVSAEFPDIKNYSILYLNYKLGIIIFTLKKVFTFLFLFLFYFCSFLFKE
jgi:hypothetical protein